MRRSAVPLLVPRPDGPHAGSGFFASYAGREWLLTAGHLPLMMSQPHGRWNEWPRTIHVLADGMVHELPLFLGMEPSFAYLGGGEEPLADFMALRVPEGFSANCRAKLFSLDGGAPEPGVKASVIGFPTHIKPWPSSELQFEVIVVGATPEITEFTPAAPKGTSGGPLVGIDGSVLGLSIGLDENGKAVSRFAIREILEANIALRSQF